MKRNPETGETATQPLPAQTADLSISGLRFILPLCTPSPHLQIKVNDVTGVTGVPKCMELLENKSNLNNQSNWISGHIGNIRSHVGCVTKQPLVQLS